MVDLTRIHVLCELRRIRTDEDIRERTRLNGYNLQQNQSAMEAQWKHYLLQLEWSKNAQSASAIACAQLRSQLAPHTAAVSPMSTVPRALQTNNDALMVEYNRLHGLTQQPTSTSSSIFHLKRKADGLREETKRVKRVECELEEDTRASISTAFA
jgi:hypothetical protein